MALICLLCKIRSGLKAQNKNSYSVLKASPRIKHGDRNEDKSA